MLPPPQTHRPGERTWVLLALALLLVAATAHAQRPRASTYEIPTDIAPAGGGEKAKSTNYVLDDTIGEGNIGFGRSDNYDLDAGYRQTTQEFLSMSCGATVGLGTVEINGRRTGSGTCLVTTDAQAGYSLSWIVSTGSGGTATGYLISQYENVIAPLTPTVVGTPQTWSVSPGDARWGARLRSSSTDTDNKWGVDNASDKWLNVGTGSYTVISRNSSNHPSGSTEILQFRAEIGTLKTQPAGTYEATVTLTAASL